MLFFMSYASSAGSLPAKEVYEQVSRNVVLIIARSQGGHKSLGAGSIISNDGLVVTNAHVVLDKDSSKACSDIKIFLKPDKVTGQSPLDLVNGHYVKVLMYSHDLDLALLSINDPPPELGKIELADSDEIKIGEEVIAIGHPEQGGLWSLTYGRISGSIENFSDITGKDVFQTDTSLNRGNSGGPLLDQRGYMVAINSNIARLSSDNLPITGVNFAIKSSVVKSWLGKEGYVIAYGQKPLVEESQERKVQESGGKTEFTEGEKAQGKKVQGKSIQKIGESKKSEAQGAEVTQEERFQTPKQPYDYDALLKAVEADLEEMMDKMRNKIR